VATSAGSPARYRRLSGALSARCAPCTPSPILTEAAGEFARRIAACRADAYAIADGAKDAPDYKQNALRARAGAIDLAVRVAHAVVAGAGGGANSLDHPAQRRFREAMFYTLTAQTGDILTATVERLMD